MSSTLQLESVDQLVQVLPAEDVSGVVGSEQPAVEGVKNEPATKWQLLKRTALTYRGTDSPVMTKERKPSQERDFDVKFAALLQDCLYGDFEFKGDLSLIDQTLF